MIKLRISIIRQIFIFFCTPTDHLAHSRICKICTSHWRSLHYSTGICNYALELVCALSKVTLCGESRFVSMKVSRALWT